MNIFQAIIDWFSSVARSLKRLFGFKDDKPTIPVISSTWTFQHSPNASISGNVFNFPSVDGVHYLVKRYDGVLRNGLELNYQISASTDAVFDFRTAPDNNPPDGVSTVTLYFQQYGDTGQNEFGRWFATGYKQELKDGTFTIVAPLDPTKWVSVFGKSGDTVPTEWKQATNNVGAVGMVFGGGYFAGHGVFVPTGTATFTILDYKAS